MAAEGLEEIADGGVGHGATALASRLPRQQFLLDIGGGEAGLERQQHDLAAGGFHFLAAGDEVRPIRALDQNVGQDCGDQLARRVFIEKRDGVDGAKRQGHAGALRFGDQRPGGAFEARDARIGVQRQDQDVAERTGAFQQADVAGMQKIVTAIGENHGFAGVAPFGARLHQFRASVEDSHVRIPLL